MGKKIIIAIFLVVIVMVNIAITTITIRNSIQTRDYRRATIAVAVSAPSLWCKGTAVTVLPQTELPLWLVS